MKDLTELSLTDLWKEYNNTFTDYWARHEEMIMYLRKVLIEGALRAEQLQYVGVGKYERGHSGKNS